MKYDRAENLFCLCCCFCCFAVPLHNAITSLIHVRIKLTRSSPWYTPGGPWEKQTMWMNVKMMWRWNVLFHKLSLFANSLEKASTYPWPGNPRKAHWTSPASHPLPDRVSALSCHMFSFQSRLVSPPSEETHRCSSFAHLTRQPVCSRDSLSEEMNVVDSDSRITCSNLRFFYLCRLMCS